MYCMHVLISTGSLSITVWCMWKVIAVQSVQCIAQVHITIELGQPHQYHHKQVHLYSFSITKLISSPSAEWTSVGSSAVSSLTSVVKTIEVQCRSPCTRNSWRDSVPACKQCFGTVIWSKFCKLRPFFTIIKPNCLMFIYGLSTLQVRVPTVKYCTVRYNHIWSH